MLIILEYVKYVKSKDLELQKVSKKLHYDKIIKNSINATIK